MSDDDAEVSDAFIDEEGDEQLLPPGVFLLLTLATSNDLRLITFKADRDTN